MNLLHLNYFYIVAREGGFTKASKLLDIQQPAISRMVRQFEDNIGIVLFERVGRSVRLTPRGSEIFQYAERIFREVDHLSFHLKNENQIPKGEIAFAASEPIANHLMPKIIEKILRGAPELYPQVISGPASDLIERIKNGGLEFGLFFHTPSIPEGLKMTVIKDIRFHLVVRGDLAKDTRVLSSFIGSREVDDTETRSFPTLNKLKKLHPKAKITVSSNNISAHKEMVLCGLGVAVLPSFMVSREIKSQKLKDLLPRESLFFKLKLIQRNSNYISNNAKALIQACANELTETTSS